MDDVLASKNCCFFSVLQERLYFLASLVVLFLWFLVLRLFLQGSRAPCVVEGERTDAISTSLLWCVCVCVCVCVFACDSDFCLTVRVRVGCKKLHSGWVCCKIRYLHRGKSSFSRTAVCVRTEYFVRAFRGTITTIKISMESRE